MAKCGSMRSFTGGAVMEPLFIFITVAVIIALLLLLYVLTPRSNDVRFIRGGAPFPLPLAPPPPRPADVT